LKLGEQAAWEQVRLVVSKVFLLVQARMQAKQLL
jgi:hypothetical protein